MASARIEFPGRASKYSIMFCLVWNRGLSFDLRFKYRVSLMPHLDSFRSLAEWPTHDTLMYIMHWLIDLLVCSCPLTVRSKSHGRSFVWPRWTRHLTKFSPRSDTNFQIFVQSIPKGWIITCGVFFVCLYLFRFWKDLWLEASNHHVRRLHCRCTSKAICRPVSEVGTLGIWDADLRKRDELIHLFILVEGDGYDSCKTEPPNMECNGNLMGM